ncbi:hypothetical protein CAMGR0001_0583 [Campylobacter gracilis RM3268]|uniref:Uncharacterized protein n=1 Tax=Campylobacter gracilis RM3268 TaxID=553220 RepID=C8PHY7_9BACT|nr:hypothetical protein CAMGR0001_0583 [Campylobacter gracilis RM3268]
MQNSLRKLAANGIFEIAVKILNALGYASHVFCAEFAFLGL